VSASAVVIRAIRGSEAEITAARAPKRARGKRRVAELLQAPGAGRSPFIKNEPRPTPGLLRMSYLTLALSASAPAFSAAAAFFPAAAATAEGSAKAITASALGL
jgi:hypothetical protein